MKLFGWKLVRKKKVDEENERIKEEEKAKQLEETHVNVYKTVVKDMFDITNILAENFVIAFKDRTGEMDLVIIMKGQIESLYGLIEVYGNNRFSSPSAEIRLRKLIDRLKSDFTKYYKTQTNANSLMLEIRTYQSQCKRNVIPDDKKEEIEGYIDQAFNNIMPVLQLQTEGLIATVRAIQSCFTCDYSIITSGANIVDVYNERQNMRTEGKFYTIKFKLVTKEQLLDTNNIKEDDSNGSA